MAKIARDQKTFPTSKEELQHEPKLKGTLASVLFLGGFIIAAWAGVYMLYLSR